MKSFNVKENHIGNKEMKLLQALIERSFLSINLFLRSYLLGDVPLGDQDDDNVSGGGEGQGAAPQPIQARPPIPDIVDNDGGLGAVHQVI